MSFKNILKSHVIEELLKILYDVIGELFKTPYDIIEEQFKFLYFAIRQIFLSSNDVTEHF